MAEGVPVGSGRYLAIYRGRVGDHVVFGLDARVRRGIISHILSFARPLSRHRRRRIVFICTAPRILYRQDLGGRGQL